MSRYRRGGEVTRATSRPQNRRRGNRIFYVVAEGEGTEYELSSNFPYQTPTNRDPSTDIYLLVERLGIVRQPR
jgi:hypothetical protein